MSSRETDIKDLPEGGYVAIYHEIEEIFYGPKLGLSANARVFLCIRHKLLRDGLCEKAIGKTFIMEKTGLDSRQVERAVKFWENSEYIVVHRSSTGKVQHENTYQLNPKKFGELYNWYKNNPTVRVYEGSKAKSYSTKGVPADLPVGVGVDLPVGVPADLPGGRPLNLSELLKKARSKNPSSNNPKKKTLIEESKFFVDKSESGSKSVQCDNVEDEKSRQLSMAKKAGIL